MYQERKSSPKLPFVSYTMKCTGLPYEVLSLGLSLALSVGGGRYDVDKKDVTSTGQIWTQRFKKQVA